MLRLESAAIKTWAQAASPRKLELTRDLGKTVGMGVVRSSGQLSRMSKVLVVLRYQTYNGKPYYILTAFPIP